MNSFDRMSALMIGGAATLLAGTAAAQEAGAATGCRLVVEAGPDQWVVSYDPFVDRAVERQFDMAVVNRGGAACAGVVGLELRGEAFGLSRDGAGQRLAYAVVDERASTDITPRTGKNVARVGARSVALAPGERTMLRFSVVVDPAEIPSAGLYTQSAFLTLEQGDGVPLTERPVTLGVRVPSAAMMGLKGEFRRSGGAATIDLGPLTEGSRQLNTTLYVLSTAGYSVSVSSANAGQLRLGATDWYVPYTLTVGNLKVDLASSQALQIPSLRARLDDYPLAVNVGTVGGRRAGNYTDMVTFTIAAL